MILTLTFIRRKNHFRIWQSSFSNLSCYFDHGVKIRSNDTNYNLIKYLTYITFLSSFSFKVLTHHFIFDKRCSMNGSTLLSFVIGSKVRVNLSPNFKGIPIYVKILSHFAKVMKIYFCIGFFLSRINRSRSTKTC